MMQEGRTPAEICCTDRFTFKFAKAEILKALSAAAAASAAVRPSLRDFLWRAANSEPDEDTFSSPAGPSFFFCSFNSHTLL